MVTEYRFWLVPWSIVPLEFLFISYTYLLKHCPNPMIQQLCLRLLRCLQYFEIKEKIALGSRRGVSLNILPNTYIAIICGFFACGFHSNDCPKSCSSLHCNIYGKIINNPFHKVHPLNFKLYRKCKHSVNVYIQTHSNWNL